MKLVKQTLVAAAVALATSGAFAQAIGGTGGLNVSANFLTLSAANVSGGAIYTVNALPFAAIPKNDAPLILTVGDWVAAGPNNTNNGGGDATLTLAAGTTYVSFLWGSPDTYNSLTVNTNFGSSMFTAASLGILPIGGDQSQANYVNFTPTGASTVITSLVFSSTTQNAIEISNVTAVPEPETYALMLAGLVGIGALVRRRSV